MIKSQRYLHIIYTDVIHITQNQPNQQWKIKTSLSQSTGMRYIYTIYIRCVDAFHPNRTIFLDQSGFASIEPFEPRKIWMLYDSIYNVLMLSSIMTFRHTSQIESIDLEEDHSVDVEYHKNSIEMLIKY